MSESFLGVALPSGVWSGGYGIVFLDPEFYISITLSVASICTQSTPIEQYLAFSTHHKLDFDDPIKFCTVKERYFHPQKRE